MRAATKFLLGAAAVIAVGTIGAQDQTLNSAADWMKNPAASDADGLLTVSRQTILTGKKFTVDPAKTTTISFSARANQVQGNDTSWVLGGFAVFDKDGRVISCDHVAIIPGTETAVAADAAKGATTLIVKDGSKLKKGLYHTLVAGAKKDLSDLPNRDIIARGIKEVVQKGDVWEITLTRGLLKDVKAGTVIREHSMGGYLYTAGSKRIGKDWVTFSGKIKGSGKSGWSASVWPVGTAQAQFIILVNWSNKKLDTQFKDVVFSVK